MLNCTEHGKKFYNFGACLLAHLSRRLTGSFQYSHDSSFNPSVRLPPFSKVFSTAAWPIKAKFQIVLQWDGGRKVCSWTRGHINKMATTPIYGKRPSKIFSRTKDERPWNFVHLFSIWDSSASQVVEMMTCSGKRKIVQMVFVTVSRWQVDLDLIYFKVNFCSLHGILEGKNYRSNTPQS